MILVTGGAGYIGSHTVLEMRREGLEVVVFDDLVNGHREAVKDSPLVVGDLCDRGKVVDTLREYKVDAVVHFAARAYVGESVDDPSKYIRDNCTGMWTLLDAMREVGVSRFVFSSTCAVYGVPDQVPITEETERRPISPYGFTKRFCEEMLESYAHAYGLAPIALRYFNASGADPEGELGEWHVPETHLIPNILLPILLGEKVAPLKVFGSDYPTPDGTCVRDYVHVNDLARAHLIAVGKAKAGQFQRFNLGTGRGFSVLEVIAAAKRVTGTDIQFEMVGRRPGDPPELVAAPDLARKELGFEARWTEIEDTVRHAWEWYASHAKGYAKD